MAIQRWNHGENGRRVLGEHFHAFIARDFNDFDPNSRILAKALPQRAVGAHGKGHGAWFKARKDVHQLARKRGERHGHLASGARQDARYICSRPTT